MPLSPGIFADFFSGFDWDLSFIAYLYYCFAVFTYFLPGADVAMVIAIVTLAVRPQNLRSHPFLLVLVLLVGWAGLTMLNSEYRTDSFQAWWNLVKTALVGIVSFLVIRTRTHLKIALAFLIGCFVLFPMRGAFINYFGGYSTAGRALWNFAYANPNDLAVYCVVFLAFTLALFPLVRNKKNRVALLCVAGLEVLLILFTQSRGSLLAVFIAGGIGLLGQRRRARTFAMVFATVALAAIAAPSGVWERLSGLKNLSVDSGMKGVDEEGSAEQRFKIARVAATVAASNPLFGVGIGTYPSAHRLYAANMGSEFATARGGRDAHNTYLLLAAELGVPGLVVFFGLLFSANLSSFRPAVRLDEPDRTALRMIKLGLLAFLLAGVFGSVPYINILYVLLAILCAAPSALSQSPPMRSPSRTGLYRRPLGGDRRMDTSLRGAVT